MRRLQRRQPGGRPFFPPQRLQQQGERLVTLLDGLGQILDGSGVLAELGHGAVQPRLAIGDQPLIVGPDLERGLVTRSQRQHSRQGGGRGHAQPERQERHQRGGRGLFGWAEDKATDLPSGADVQMPLGKQALERKAQPRQAVHVDFGSPHPSPPRYEAKSKQ